MNEDNDDDDDVFYIIFDILQKQITVLFVVIVYLQLKIYNYLNFLIVNNLVILKIMCKILMVNTIR